MSAGRGPRGNDIAYIGNDGTAALALAVGLTACALTNPLPDVRPENTDDRCADGSDNDLDGSLDCADSDCRGTTPCFGTEPERGPTCDNGIDDDGDRFVDASDAACWPGASFDVLRCSTVRGASLEGQAALDAFVLLGSATEEPVPSGGAQRVLSLQGTADAAASETLSSVGAGARVRAEVEVDASAFREAATLAVSLVPADADLAETPIGGFHLVVSWRRAEGLYVFVSVDGFDAWWDVRRALLGVPNGGPVMPARIDLTIELGADAVVVRSDTLAPYHGGEPELGSFPLPNGFETPRPLRVRLWRPSHDDPVRVGPIGIDVPDHDPCGYPVPQLESPDALDLLSASFDGDGTLLCILAQREAASTGQLEIVSLRSFDGGRRFDGPYPVGVTFPAAASVTWDGQTAELSAIAVEHGRGTVRRFASADCERWTPVGSTAIPVSCAPLGAVGHRLRGDQVDLVTACGGRVQEHTWPDGQDPSSAGAGSLPGDRALQVSYVGDDLVVVTSSAEGISFASFEDAELADPLSMPRGSPDDAGLSLAGSTVPGTFDELGIADAVLAVPPGDSGRLITVYRGVGWSDCTGRACVGTLEVLVR